MKRIELNKKVMPGITSDIIIRECGYSFYKEMYSKCFDLLWEINKIKGEIKWN